MTKVRKKYLVKHAEKGVIGHYEVCYQNYSGSAWIRNMCRRYAMYRLDGTLIGYETAKGYIAGRMVTDMYESVILNETKKVVVE